MCISSHPVPRRSGTCGRAAKIVETCQGKSVLHLGCADWPYTERRIRNGELLHARLARVCRKLIGVDLSAEGIRLLRSLCPDWELHLADACQFEPDDHVDLILASELIEHVEDPGKLLRSLARWAKPGTKLLVTTPNAYALKGTARALLGGEFCHPEHTVMFSTATLSQLLHRTGWAVGAVDYYHLPARRLLAKIPSAFVFMLTRVASPRVADGLIVLASRNGQNGGPSPRNDHA